MAAARAICPVCGESTVYAPGSPSPAACPRCGSSFAEHVVTLADPLAARQSFVETLRLPQAPPAEVGHPSDLPQIPGYDVLDFVARGAMGVVLKARHQVLNRLVAIKMPLYYEPSDTAGRERFLREARAAAQLRHPNICPTYEVGECGGRPYIAMAYIEGIDLREWAKSRRPSPREAAELVARVARAVAHAHQHGVVHRDIKPGNIMMDAETGEPVLTDFGLAKELTEHGAEVTLSGQVVGTPAYMAPEQAAGRSDLVGPHSDVYALGGVLYELLCDRPPFLGTVTEILNSVQRDTPQPPRRLNPRIHRDLETVCLKALAKEPPDRYRSAQELGEDLERFGAGEAIRARPERFVGRAVRRVRRNPLVFAAAVAVLIAAGAVGHFALRASHTRRIAALVQSLEAGLDSEDWSAERLASQDALLAELGRLAPDRAASARQRLHQRFADSIAESLRRPVLQTEDMPGIESALARLAARAPEAASTLRQSLGQRLRVWQPVFSLEPPFAGLASVLDPAGVRIEAGALVPQGASGAAASRTVLTRMRCGARVQIEAVFDEGWGSASALGLLLNATTDEGYSFILRPAKVQPAEQGGPKPTPTSSFASLRGSSGLVSAGILRHALLLQEQSWPVSKLAPGRLRLVASREGGRLSFQVNDLPPVIFEDIFPIKGKDLGAYGLCCSGGVRLLELRGRSQALPMAPSPLERGDDLYGRSQFEEALGFYREQAIASRDKEIVQEARYKEGLSLVGLKREEEAARVFESLVAEPEKRWPVLAACQLWALRLQQDRLSEADAILDGLSARHKFEKLALQIPADLRTRIVDAYARDARLFDLVLKPNPNTLKNLERSIAVRELCGTPAAYLGYDKRGLLRAYCSAGQMAAAGQLAEELVRADPEDNRSCMDYAWFLRLRGEPGRALAAVDRLLGAPGQPNADHRVLLVERSRIHAALGQWPMAEKDAEDFLRLVEPSRDNYREYSAACLILGILREKRGDAAGALDAWRRGVLKRCLGGKDAPGGAGPYAQAWEHTAGQGLLHGGILASLVDELTDAEAAALQAAIVSAHAKDSPFRALQELFAFPPSVLRGMWRRPRGRDVAQVVALQSVPQGELTLRAGLLAFTEMVRQSALGGQSSPEQDDLIWNVVDDGRDGFIGGKLSLAQIIQLGLAWKGTTGLLGWGGVAPSLAPRLRGPAAYILGHRYLRLDRRGDALAFFRTALADAAPESPLRRLAQAELDRLKSNP